MNIKIIMSIEINWRIRNINNPLVAMSQGMTTRVNNTDSAISRVFIPRAEPVSTVIKNPEIKAAVRTYRVKSKTKSIICFWHSGCA
jgi:hypothetical protein